MRTRRHIFGLVGLALLGGAACSGNTITLPGGSTVKVPEGVSIPKVTIPKGGTIPKIDPAKLPKIDPSKLPKLPEGALPELQFPENKYPTQTDPATPGVKVQKGPDATIYSVASDVSFDFDSATLKPEAQQALKNVVTQIKQKYPGSSIESRGHTDSVGSDDYNMALSNRRAESVKRYLVSQGLEENRIKTVGFGETVPIQSNDTEEGRAINRRAEVVVVTK